MKVGIFGDVHLTKNMRNMQSTWENSAMKSILNMYKNFDEEKIDLAICLGDFFDKPIIEAKSLHLVLPILTMMNSKSYPTYILLGNHEVDDDEHNILEYLSEYVNIKPITDSDIIMNEFTLIPYIVNPEELPSEFLEDKYVFTHHDIYGSALASGQTKAFFGINPEIFKNAKRVFNGHVHLKSKISTNIINAGSLLVSQQGELLVGDYPSYYILESESNTITEYENEYSMIYQAIDVSDIDKISQYDANNLVLRVDYEGEIPENYLDALHTSWRKKIVSISGEDKSNMTRTSNFDLKSYLVDYIKKDTNVSDSDKERYIKVGLEVLS